MVFRNKYLLALSIILLLTGAVYLVCSRASLRLSAAETHAEFKMAQIVGELDVLVDEDEESYCVSPGLMADLLKKRDCVSEKTVYVEVDDNFRQYFYDRVLETGWLVQDNGSTDEHGFMEPGLLIGQISDASDENLVHESDLYVHVVKQESVDAMKNVTDEAKFKILNEATKPIIRLTITTEYEG